MNCAFLLDKLGSVGSCAHHFLVGSPIILRVVPATKGYDEFDVRILFPEPHENFIILQPALKIQPRAVGLHVHVGDIQYSKE